MIVFLFFAISFVLKSRAVDFVSIDACSCVCFIFVGDGCFYLFKGFTVIYSAHFICLKYSHLICFFEKTFLHLFFKFVFKIFFFYLCSSHFFLYTFHMFFTCLVLDLHQLKILIIHQILKIFHRRLLAGGADSAICFLTKGACRTFGFGSWRYLQYILSNTTFRCFFQPL